MSLSNQGSNQANSWAVQRREAIEKAQKLRDDRKFGLAKTGEMTMSSHNPRDKNATMNPQSSTGKGFRPGMTTGPGAGSDNNYGYKKSLTSTFDYSAKNQSAVPHEEHQQATSSLRLLKAKMSGGRSNTQDYDQLDTFVGETANAKKYPNTGKQQEYNKQENVRRQPLDEVSNQSNQNYRKVFKPNFDNDEKPPSRGQPTQQSRNQPSRAQAAKQGGYMDERQLKTIPIVQDDEDTGFSSHNIPSRIPKSTAGQQKAKGQNYEDNYYDNSSNYQMGGKLGSKRGRDEHAGYGDESPSNDYLPASKQQRQQEKRYDPSMYSANPPAKGFSKEPVMDSYKPKTNVQKGPSKPAYQDAYSHDYDEDHRKPRNDPFEMSEENVGGSEELIECPEGCGRRFFHNVIDKHANVCRKVFQSKRKQFNMAEQRQTEDQAKLGNEKKPSKFNPNRTGAAPSAAANKEKPLSKKAKWKQQSEAFRANLKAARGGQLSEGEQMAVARNDDLVQCDYCARRFNEEAAKRHIPFCQTKSKINSMKRVPPKAVGKSKK